MKTTMKTTHTYLFEVFLSASLLAGLGECLQCYSCDKSTLDPESCAPQQCAPDQLYCGMGELTVISTVYHFRRCIQDCNDSELDNFNTNRHCCDTDLCNSPPEPLVVDTKSYEEDDESLESQIKPVAYKVQGEEAENGSQSTTCWSGIVCVQLLLLYITCLYV